MELFNHKPTRGCVLTHPLYKNVLLSGKTPKRIKFLPEVP